MVPQSETEASRASDDDRKLVGRPTREPASWAALALIAALSVAVLFAAEWLFFATKPSFLSTLPFRSKVLVLVLSPLVPVCAALIAIAVLFAVSRAGGAIAAVARNLALLLPALALGFTALLMATNFTNTLFGFGIGTSRGVVRILWLLGFLALLVWGFRFGVRTVGRLSEGSRPRAVRRAVAALALLALGGAAFLFASRRQSYDLAPSIARAGVLPNILLIGGDGLEASHLSAYGYARKTTPNLDRLATESLVARNAFPNAENTGASTISILTGKLPSETGVVYPPDILRGGAAYEHLPGILRGLGYETAQLTIRHYGDAFDLNLRRGFDEVNSRSAPHDDLSDALQSTIGGNSAYFVEQTLGRVRDRTLHLFWIRDMRDAYAAVTEKRDVEVSDRANVDALLDLLADRERPLFAHLHLLGTHGPLFYPSERPFSERQRQIRPWMRDFYDDAVLEFDAHLGRILEALGDAGRLDDTIVVVYSDHGMENETTTRLPLLFRFPRGQARGTVEANAQGIDIAPTLLEYLGVAKPGWMSGSSLLSPVDPCRPMFAIRSDPEDHRLEEGLWQAAGGAGSARIGSVSVISCDRSFVVTPSAFEEETVRGHSGPCDGCAPDLREIRERAIVVLTTRPGAASQTAGPAAAPRARPASATDRPRPTSVGTFRARGGTFHLRLLLSGEGVISFGGGRFGDVALAGDWDGDGRTEVGLYRPADSSFTLYSDHAEAAAAATPIPFGAAGDVPVAGDWDGDGRATIGIYRPSSAAFHLRNQNAPGPADLVITFGAIGDLPVSGDWDGDGVTTIGVFRPSDATFFLRNSNDSGQADVTIPFGTPDDVPLVGDWNGDGRTDIGLFRPSLSTFFLTTQQGGMAEITIPFGNPGDQPVAGRW